MDWRVSRCDCFFACAVNIIGSGCSETDDDLPTFSKLEMKISRWNNVGSVRVYNPKRADKSRQPGFLGHLEETSAVSASQTTWLPSRYFVSSYSVRNEYIGQY